MITPRLAAAAALLPLAALTACDDDGDERKRPSGTQAHGSASPSPTRSAALDTQFVQGEWWEWVAKARSGRNPVEDTTGEYCAVGQKEPYWFLAGTFGGSVHRRCTVPSGRQVIAPVVNLQGDEYECGAFLATASGGLKLDGRPVRIQRWDADQILFSAVKGNPVTRKPGAYSSYGCGLWAVLPKLSPGRHRVQIRGTSHPVTVAADYDLIVSGR